MPLQGSASKGAVGFMARHKQARYGPKRRTNEAWWTTKERSLLHALVWAHPGSTPAKLHVIRLKEVSTNAENVAIPTRRIQDLKESQGNYVRNL